MSSGRTFPRTVHCFSVPPTVGGTTITTPTPSTTTSPLETTLSQWTQHTAARSKPLSNSVLFFPPEMYLENVTYYLPIAAMQLGSRSRRRFGRPGKNDDDDVDRIRGLASIQEACSRWDTYFETDRGDVTFHLQRVSLISPTTVIVQWNVTWVPPTAQWMLRLVVVDEEDNNHPPPLPPQAQPQRRRWKADYRSYNHLSGTPSTFSYVGLFHLWVRALTMGILTIPLACIQGTTTCEMMMVKSSTMTNHSAAPSSATPPPFVSHIYSIRETLVLAQELDQGYLKNRKCAQDLKLFLESGRRIQGDINDVDLWDTVVETSLPWSSVPGMMGLEVDANAKGEEWVPLAFLGFSAMAMVGFAWLLAQELLVT